MVLLSLVKKHRLSNKWHSTTGYLFENGHEYSAYFIMEIATRTEVVKLLPLFKVLTQNISMC